MASNGLLWYAMECRYLWGEHGDALAMLAWPGRGTMGVSGRGNKHTRHGVADQPKLRRKTPTRSIVCALLCLSVMEWYGYIWIGIRRAGRSPHRGQHLPHST